MGISRYLSVGTGCNLRCNYCYNDKQREENVFFLELKDIIKTIIKIRTSRNNITIIGGEPLLHPNFLKFLFFIKKVNFDYVYLITNGIKFYDNNYLITFFFLNSVTDIKFSINSHNIKIDNLISGRKGNNFFKREKGIKNLIKLNNKYKEKKIILHSNLVINNYNVKYIKEIVDYTYNLGIKNITISFIYNLYGFSEKNLNSLVKYTKAINIINNINVYKDLKLRIDWLPFCLHKNIKLNRKYIIREVFDYNDKSGYSNEKDNKKNNKIQLKECKRCSVYGKYCNGVFKEYVNIFGEKEFKGLSEK